MTEHPVALSQDEWHFLLAGYDPLFERCCNSSDDLRGFYDHLGWLCCREIEDPRFRAQRRRSRYHAFNTTLAWACKPLAG